MTINREELLERGRESCDAAIEYSKKGAHSRALEYFANAEYNFRQLGDEHWLTFMRHEKLQTLKALKNYEDAFHLAELVADGYLATKNFKGLALLMAHKANLYMDQEDFVPAAECLRIAESVAAKENSEGSLSYIYSNTALNYLNQGNYVGAIRYFNKAMDLYESPETTFEKAWCLQHLGICFQTIYNFGKADRLLEASYQIYLKNGDFGSAVEVMDHLRRMCLDTRRKDKAKALGEMILRTKRLHIRG